jgi:hypothetical protein
MTGAASSVTPRHLTSQEACLEQGLLWGLVEDCNSMQMLHDELYMLWLSTWL